MFQQAAPDLIIMDIIMPVMDGIEAARQIRALQQQEEEWVPIIFLSAKQKSEDIEKAIDAGGDDYLIKPVDQVVLNAKLRAMERIVAMRKKLQQANHALRMMSVRDGLTGIANRRYFDETLAREMKRAQRSGRPLSLIMCDIDHFKAYNDNYGHQAGDDCLKYVARTLANVSKRPGDLVARYGGEEFAIILPETNLDGAQQIAKAVHQAVEQLGLTHHYSPVADHVTISMGVATITPDRDQAIKTSIRQLIKAADEALYQAKAAGRNQIAVAASSD